MGCGTSIDIKTIEDKLGEEIPLTVWKQEYTKTDARNRYEKEGTIPMNCTDDVLELRCYLTDPFLLKMFAIYANSVDKLRLLLAWTDILSFKRIDS